MLKALNVTELFKPLKALIVKFLKISPVIRPLNPKESNGPLIDNKIFNRPNRLNFRCAQLCNTTKVKSNFHISKIFRN